MYLYNTSEIPLWYLSDTSDRYLWDISELATHIHRFCCSLTQSDAERCRAMQSDAKRCKAMQSDAIAIYRKPERPRKLLPTRLVNKLTTNAYYNVLRKYCSVIPFSDFSCFSSLYSFFKCYSSTIVITHLVTSLYMCELMVQVSSSFVNKIRSTSIFSFSDIPCFAN